MGWRIGFDIWLGVRFGWVGCLVGFSIWFGCVEMEIWLGWDGFWLVGDKGFLEIWLDWIFSFVRDLVGLGGFGLGSDVLEIGLDFAGVA